MPCFTKSRLSITQIYSFFNVFVTKLWLFIKRNLNFCDFLSHKLIFFWLFFTIWWLFVTYIYRLLTVFFTRLWLSIAETLKLVTVFFTSLWAFITNAWQVFNCWFYIFVFNFLIKFFWKFYLNVLFYTFFTSLWVFIRSTWRVFNCSFYIFVCDLLVDTRH